MTAKTILVVDDSRSARFAMRRFLENLGYAVETADNAEDALGYLSANAPEVVFLDHVMPGTDGLMALKAIKQDARTAWLPVVLCSSNEGEDFLREARASGAVDVLPKPPATEQLRAVLERVDRMREQAQARQAEAQAAEAAFLHAEDAARAPLEAAAADAAGEPPDQALDEPLNEPQDETLGETLDMVSFAAAPIDASAAPPPHLAAAPAADATPAAAAMDEPGYAMSGDGTAFEIPAPAQAPAAEALEALRLEFDGRLREVAQALQLQMESMHAQLARAQSPAAAAAEEPAARSVAAAAAAEQGLAQLAQDVERRLQALRDEVEEALRRQQRRIEELMQDQYRRIEEIGAGLRASLTEETTAAGARLAEQLADALVRGLRSP
ncbi:MAG: response regulator [Nevskia sp.]|nr:response regulator [Nevskia sp.]